MILLIFYPQELHLQQVQSFLFQISYLNLFYFFLYVLDPYFPKFREWLCSLGAGIYVNSFLQSGYDLQFIAQHGLQDDDLDAIGIPLTQMGIRRKLKLLHRISEFITIEQNDENGDGDDENSDGDEEEGDASEEGSNEDEESDEDDDDEN